MDIFNFPVQAGINESTKAKINKVQFDDGYEQRTKKGIKNMLRSFLVRFVGTYYKKKDKYIIDGDSKAVIAFLEKQEGYKAFSWTSFRYPSSEPVKVYCEEWNTTYNQGVIEISMTFKETM